MPHNRGIVIVLDLTHPQQPLFPKGGGWWGGQNPKLCQEVHKINLTACVNQSTFDDSEYYSLTLSHLCRKPKNKS